MYNKCKGYRVSYDRMRQMKVTKIIWNVPNDTPISSVYQLSKNLCTLPDLPLLCPHGLWMTPAQNKHNLIFFAHIQLMQQQKKWCIKIMCIKSEGGVINMLYVPTLSVFEGHLSIQIQITCGRCVRKNSRKSVPTQINTVMPK